MLQYFIVSLNTIKRHHSVPVMVVFPPAAAAAASSGEPVVICRPPSSIPPTNNRTPSQVLIDFHRADSSPPNSSLLVRRELVSDSWGQLVACGDRLEWTDTRSAQRLASKQRQMSKWLLLTLPFIRQLTALLGFTDWIKKYIKKSSAPQGVQVAVCTI